MTLPARFDMRRHLGDGMFGTVWLAYDRERGVDVAVKRLNAKRESDVWRFKGEFRSLASMHHENLATLYELLNIDGQWLLTMEYVEGRALESAADWHHALAGIVAGLSALHAGGQLHRDLKHSNVLLSGTRAVLLDFGLVGQIGESSKLVGSLMGIAPEQLAHSRLHAASDYYALGTMLYISLVGAPPFQGRGAEVIARKMRHDAPRVCEVDAQAAKKHPLLAELADALLIREPTRRLESADRVLARLGIQRSGSAAPVLVRRHEHHDALHDELLRASKGAVRHVRIRGGSGIGKSTLVQAWADQLAGDAANVYSGRCFELDSSDHRGMDDIVRRLVSDPSRLTDTLEEEQAAALAQVYPGAGIPANQVNAAEPVEGAETIRRATSALTLVLSETPACPVLVLDDAHWGDETTGRLLARLAPSRLLLVTIHRAEADDLGLLRALDAERPPDRVIEVDRLGRSALVEFATRMNVEDVESFISQSKGHPLLAQELVRAGGGPGSSMDLIDLLAARVRTLPASAAFVLDLLTVAARPTERALLDAALESVGDETAFAAIAILQRQRFVKTTHTWVGARVELMHDAMGQANAVPMNARKGAYRAHCALDDAMDTLGLDDPESQAVHARGAKRPAKALTLFVSAGERASDSMRFERAAELYGEAVGLCEHRRNEEVRRRGLHLLQAKALGHAGRHAEAARASLHAIDGRTLRIEDAFLMDASRCHAEYLLHAGDIDAGYSAMALCLDAASLPSPTRSAWVLPSMLLDMRRIRADGYRCESTPGASSVEGQTQTDLCFSAGLALTNIDIRGAAYVLRSVTLASQTADSHRYARGLGVAASYVGTGGWRAEPQLTRMIREVEREGERRDDPYLRGLALGARCVRHFHIGQYDESLRLACATERAFRSTGASMRERVSAQIYRCANLATKGHWSELDVQRQRLLNDSLTRGDRFGATASCVGLGYMTWLANEQPVLARTELENAIERWGHARFQIQHFFALMGLCRVDLYEQKPTAALARIRRARVSLIRSLLWRMPFVRVQIRELEGRALLMLKGPWSRVRRLRMRWLASRIEAENAPCYIPLLQVLRAGEEWATGRPEAAATLLQGAIGGFAKIGQSPHAEAARHSLALVGEASPAETPGLWSAIGWAPSGEQLGVAP